MIVQKFGGTSVGTPEKIRAVAGRIAARREQGEDLVVVVSAILSWLPLDPYHPVVSVVRRLSDILCDPIRRIVPMHSLGIDLSPLFAVLLLQFTNQFLVESLRQLGARLG